MSKRNRGGEPDEVGGVSRRRFIQATGATAAVIGASGAFGGLDWAGATLAEKTKGTIKLGYVTPRTGPLAGFGEADSFVIDNINKVFSKGLKINGASWGVQVLSKDSQSDANRAATVTGDLILSDGVDMVLAAGTPETTNPVADQCEANGVPCITSVAPWQSYFFGRKGDPKVGFQWTYHFFWGLEDLISVYLDMWSQVQTNKKVGAIWPNDNDGNAFADPKTGFPPALQGASYALTDPGRYPDMNANFSSQIQAFKSASADLLTGVPIPPDFATFWTQAQQQGYKPKVATVAKALLFPSTIDALGPAGNLLSTEEWWSPQHPFRSSLTGQTCKQLSDAYEAQTGKQWTQPIGFAHALFEVAAGALQRSKDPKNKAGVKNAIPKTNISTIVGPLKWGGKTLPKNIAKTPLVGGQWTKATSGKFNYNLVIVSNKDHPNIPATGKLQPIA